MTIELAIVISLVSLFFGIFQGVSNLNRNKTTDDKKDATEISAILVRAELSKSDITELKSRVKKLEEDNQLLRERTAVNDEIIKNINKRLDNIDDIFKK